MSRAQSYSHRRAHSPTFPSFHLHHNSFSNLSVSSPTSQLILQPFCRFTYITAHFPTLPLFHLRHSSFSNPSFASPRTQVLHLIHLASCPWSGLYFASTIPWMFLWRSNLMQKIHIYEGHPESKERLRIQSTHLFCCSQSLISGIQCDVWKVAHAVVGRTLSCGKCRDSCGHGCANWECCRLWGARCYLFSAGQWDLRLSCRRGKFSRGIVLLHDNARLHTAQQTQALLHE